MGRDRTGNRGFSGILGVLRIGGAGRPPSPPSPLWETLAHPRIWDIHDAPVAVGVKWSRRIHRDTPIPKDPPSLGVPLPRREPGSCRNSSGSAGIHPKDPSRCRCRGSDPSGSRCHLLLAPFPVTRLALPGGIHPSSSVLFRRLRSEHPVGAGRLPASPQVFLAWGKVGIPAWWGLSRLGCSWKHLPCPCRIPRGSGSTAREMPEFPGSLRSPHRDSRKINH